MGLLLHLHPDLSATAGDLDPAILLRCWLG
jgi:hypothetical protein